MSRQSYLQSRLNLLRTGQQRMQISAQSQTSHIKQVHFFLLVFLPHLWEREQTLLSGPFMLVNIFSMLHVCYSPEELRQAYMETPQNISRFDKNHEECNPHLEIQKFWLSWGPVILIQLWPVPDVQQKCTRSLEMCKRGLMGENTS